MAKAVAAIQSEEKRDDKGRFIVPPKSPGRPLGAKNKLGEDFVAALQADFAEHGPDVVAKVRDEEPTQYLKVIASIIPKEVHHTVEEYDNLSDDELEQRFLREAGKLAAARGNTGRKGTQGQPEQVLN